MESLSKSQVLKTVLLLLLLLYIPFVPPSLRPSYLYFVLNILIVALGVEAGFLKSISGPLIDKKLPTVAPVLSTVLNLNTCYSTPHNNHNYYYHHHVNGVHDHVINQQQDQAKAAATAKLQERRPQLLQVENVMTTTTATTSTAADMRRKKLKRCQSRPSIFFICGHEGGDHQSTTTAGPKRAAEEKQKVPDEAEELGKWEEAAGELTKQELFAKAEEFIGNFYEQLKMQRKESWKKIHGLYNRAF